MDNMKQKWCVLVSKYPLNSQKWPFWMILMTSTDQFQIFIADHPIHDTSYCLQANNCQLFHTQHHGKVTSVPSWILPNQSNPTLTGWRPQGWRPHNPPSLVCCSPNRYKLDNSLPSTKPVVLLATKGETIQGRKLFTEIQYSKKIIVFCK